MDKSVVYNARDAVWKGMGGDTKSACASYCYRMAKYIKTGNFINSGGGNCGTQTYESSLISLGWNKILEIPTLSRKELIDRIVSHQDVEIGDIIEYKCLSPCGYDNAYVYGHTQMYFGGKTWESSKNWNYQCQFVYPSYGSNKQWRYKVFRFNGTPSPSGYGCTPQQDYENYEANVQVQAITNAQTKRRAAQLVSYFMQQLNLTDKQASGIVGNLMHESQLNNTAQNKSGAFGIAQWLSSRKDRLKERYGNDYTKFDTQKEYVVWEYNNNPSYYHLDELRNAQTIDSATQLVFKYYEAPNDDSLGKRKSYAKQAYDLYHGRDI